MGTRITESRHNHKHAEQTQYVAQ